MKKIISFVFIITCFMSGVNALAQATLFEFPIAPDTCTSIESRCNYSVQHFWDKCELTKPFDAKNDSLLMDAMLTYFDIMRAGANVNVSLTSVRNLMFKAQANHDNFLRLASVAEYLLYYHDFEFIDDLYIAFAQSVADANWAKKEVRNHYADQVKRLSTTKLGQPMPDFEYTSITGVRKHLFDNKIGSKVYVLLFTDTESSSSIERMRLSTDVAISQLVESDHLEIINILITDAPKKWDADSQSYADTWVIGATKDVLNKIDLRIMPCVYLLDENFNIIAKNKTVDFIKNAVRGR